MITRVQAGGTPSDRLTRIAGCGLEAACAHPEAGGEIIVVLVTDTAAGEHGTAVSGLSADPAADVSAAVDLLLGHAEALCRSIGRPIAVRRV